MQLSIILVTTKLLAVLLKRIHQPSVRQPCLLTGCPPLVCCGLAQSPASHIRFIPFRCPFLRCRRWWRRCWVASCSAPLRSAPSRAIWTGSSRGSRWAGSLWWPIRGWWVGGGLETGEGDRELKEENGRTARAGRLVMRLTRLTLLSLCGVHCGTQVLYLFLVGLELDPAQIAKTGTTALKIALAGQ